MWVVFLAIFGVVAALMFVNARARSRLEKMGGDAGNPVRRHWWMRSGS